MRAFARGSIGALAASPLVLTSICLFAGIGFSFCKITHYVQSRTARAMVATRAESSPNTPPQQLVAERSYRNNGARAQLIGQTEDEMLTQLSSGLECATSLERVAAALTRTLAANSLDLSKSI